MMNSPNATGQTAIRVLGGDVVGSLQHTPSMDSMRAPALTSPMNFSATSSVSQPPRWMPKERRRRDQRGDHASAERLDEAFERPLPPIRLRPLFWIGEWTTRQGDLPRERAPPQRPTCATSITNPTEPWESLGEICACLACQREFCPVSLLRAGPHLPDSC